MTRPPETVYQALQGKKIVNVKDRTGTSLGDDALIVFDDGTHLLAKGWCWKEDEDENWRHKIGSTLEPNDYQIDDLLDALDLAIRSLPSPHGAFGVPRGNDARTPLRQAVREWAEGVIVERKTHNESLPHDLTIS